MRWWIFVLLALLICGCVPKTSCDIEYWYEEGKRIGLTQGIDKGINMAEEYGVKCPWDEWTEADRDCLYILNGETEYNTAWIICEEWKESQYLRIKEILDEPRDLYFNATNLTSELNSSLVATGDDGFRAITWDYNYGDKEWKYFTMMGGTCHQVPCSCADWGCLAYCMECEGINESEPEPTSMEECCYPGDYDCSASCIYPIGGYHIE